MIAILHDGINIDIPFEPILEKFPADSISIINIHTFDFETEFGIHVSPSYLKLLDRLIPKNRKIGLSSRLSNLLKKLGIADIKLSDFDLLVSILMSLWLKGNRPIVEFYRKMTDLLKLPYEILPLLEATPILVFELKDETKTNILNLLDKNLVSDIKNIAYMNLEKTKIVDETKSVLEESKLILLYQVSPLTIYCLKSIGPIKKILENFKGSVVYILPNKLEDLDKVILEILGYETNLHGLIEMAHEQIDAVIFNEKKRSLLENFDKLKISIYPMSFNFNTEENINTFVENILKIISQ